ncbi:hypothetical protein HRI_003814800 [Hibiscus trionum]|uniref:KIB1-4 beta-propeller domain-containing protein n=1 Tax=Hibiscus trionum TaxID=183268 RepID=A0A9W7ITS6_HIBTR|nr:hypothetical protein HRI_003814800 [Hibiscus trionum]
MASCEGWLLLFCEGSMFFFCPLSRAKIDIPGTFPHTVTSNHVAILSAPLTSEDCVVGVISRTKTEIKFHAFRRGATSWTEHNLKSKYPKRIRYAAYHKRGFYFFDNTNLMVYYSIDQPELRLAEARYVKPETDDEGIIFRFDNEEETNQMNELKERLALEDMSQVSICGTIVSCDNARINKMVPYENNRVLQKQGAWFQPRLHQISENQSW